MSSFDMFRRSACARYCEVLGAVALVMSTMNANADGILTIKPYAALTETYDDNLFRLSNRAQAQAVLNSTDMSDKITHSAAGVNADVELSRQKLRVELGIDHSDFDRNSFLDNTGHSSKLAWYWQLGHSLNGEASISDSEAMSGFSEVHNAVLNMRTLRHRLLSANWDLTSNWRFYALKEELTSENSLASYLSSNHKEDIDEEGVQYTTTAGNMLGFSVRNTHGSYPNRDFFSSIFFGNSNDQRDIAASLQWQPTGKIHIRGRMANVSREYKDFSQRDFQGYTERVDVDWTATGKTALGFSAWKEINGVDDLGSTYVQTKGVSLTPTWQATAKLGFTGQLSYEKRDYLGDPVVIFTPASRREDEVRTSALTLIYVPMQRLQVQLGYVGEHRTASTATNGYRDTTVNASVRFEY